jgi:hypothetical protein
MKKEYDMNAIVDVMDSAVASLKILVSGDKKPTTHPSGMTKYEWLQWVYQQSRQRQGIESVRVRRDYD